MYSIRLRLNDQEIHDLKNGHHIVIDIDMNKLINIRINDLEKENQELRRELNESRLKYIEDLKGLTSRYKLVIKLKNERINKLEAMKSKLLDILHGSI